MSVILPAHKDVRLLDDRDKERLFVLLADLREFHDAYIFHRVVRSQRLAPPTVIRFFGLALRNALHALYLAGPGDAIVPMLRSIGRDDLADNTERILETEVEGTNYRTTLNTVRNRLQAHRRLSFKGISEAANPVLGLSNQAQARLAALDEKLLRRTAALYRYMCRMFPELDAVQVGELSVEAALESANAKPLAPAPKTRAAG